MSQKTFKDVVFLFFVFLGSFTYAHTHTSDLLKYDIAYEQNTQSPFLKISLSFTGNQEGHSTIEFPSTEKNFSNLYKNFSDIHVVGASLNNGTLCISRK